MSSSQTSERNTKLHKLTNAQKPDAALVKHTDMAQNLSNYDCADTRHQEINYQEVNFDEQESKVYHGRGLLNDNKMIIGAISKSVYEIFIKIWTTTTTREWTTQVDKRNY